jgi:hypothetical protein
VTLRAPEGEAYDGPRVHGGAPLQEFESEEVGRYASFAASQRFREGDQDRAAGEPEFPDPAEKSNGEEPMPPPQRLRIYVGRLELLVPNAADATAKLLGRLEALGGYVEKRENASFTCRVPAAAFEKLVGEVRGWGKVLNDLVQAIDVTKQYQDLRLRLESAQASHKRLLELLAKADKVEDMLKIEAELRRLTEEIERMTAELRSLSEEIAYSKLQVVFREEAPAPVAKRPRGPSRFEWINQVGVEPLLERF